MHCTDCGAEIREQAKFCTECGAPTQTAQPHPEICAPTEQTAEQESVDPVPAPKTYRGRLVVAIIACVLFFLPTGIAAIVFASKATHLSKAGKPRRAKRAARRSTLFSVLSVVCNILWNLIGAILLVQKYGSFGM